MITCRVRASLRTISILVLPIAGLVISGCERREAPQPTSAQAGAGSSAVERQAGEGNPLRNAYFGDLHVHTSYSFDAYIFTTRTTPDDAYRYAKGEAIEHPLGYKLQLLSGPLDFQAVADHAEFLGIVRAMADPEQAVSKYPLAKQFTSVSTPEESRQAFQTLVGLRGPEGTGEPPAELVDWDVMRAAWRDIIEAAERHYDPGRFTTFVGFEYTSGPSFQNLHRNVIFRGAEAPDLPFSAMISENPEDLWAWMDTNRAAGMEAIAIPHNSNGSNGQMFKLTSFGDQPLDAAYADLRMRNEPVVEVSQVKGSSEVHPSLAPNDEWANFEIFPYRIGAAIPSEPVGSYVREAYVNGLVMEEQQGFNPFRFGLIGSTDTHNSAGTPEEANFHGKVGILDGLPVRRGSVPLEKPRPDGSRYADVYYQRWSAAGLAGVWAEENTRESLFDALRRKEVFATSGPRIRIRFFGSFDYSDALPGDHDMIAKAYADGVPMGGDLHGLDGRAPRFLVWATRDPNSSPLQRLQIVKGWVEDGSGQQKVFDIACSDGLTPDPASHRCPDNGATVNLENCSISQDLGAPELLTLWSDPEFAAGQRAVYYVRVLENPSCRWSTWDAIRAGVEPRPDLQTTIQERAWSSPIWYVPPQ